MFYPFIYHHMKFHNGRSFSIFFFTFAFYSPSLSYSCALLEKYALFRVEEE